MFKIGDVVVYKNSGICKITDIEHVNFGIGEKDYYVLNYFYQNSYTKILLPVDNCDQIRRIMSKNDALSLIDNMANAKNIWVNDNKVRKEKFLKIINDCNKEELCSLLYTLYHKEKELEDTKKGLNLTDKKIFETAEQMIFEELATALNIKLEDILDYIQKRLEKKN